MTPCENCGGRAQLFLCPRCLADLREMLARLPRWLTHLEETAYGQIRFSSAAGRRNGRSGGLIRYTDETPALDGLGGMEGQRRLEQDAEDGKLDLRKVLAAGRINALACERRDKITSMLSTWIRDICETRGLDVPTLGSDAGAMSRWLAICVGALAANPGAGEFYDELTEHIRSIERIINPPTPLRFCGPCPSSRGRECRCAHRHPHQCGTRLMAKRTAIEVTCPACRQTHNIEALMTHLLNWAEQLRFTAPDTLLIMETLAEPISERTFRQWRNGSKKYPPALHPRGYQRPTGAIGLTRHSVDDQPVYRLAEVRKLRNRQEATA